MKFSISIPIFLVILSNFQVLSASDTSVLGIKDDLGTWEKHETKLSSARSNLAAASAGDYAIFAGGIDSNGEKSDIVDMFNFKDSSIRNVSLSESRSDIGSGTFHKGRYAIFAGGKKKDNELSSVVDIYDSLTDKWKVLHMKQPRSNPLVLDIGKKLVIFGGVLSSPPFISNVIDYFDEDLNQTDGTQDAFPYPIHGIGAGNDVLNNGVILGGYMNIEPESNVPNFTPNNQTLFYTGDYDSDTIGLKTMQTMSHAKFGMTGALSLDIFIFGGGFTQSTQDGSIVESDEVYGYNTRRHDYANINLKLSEPRSYIYSGGIQRFVLFWGGGSSKSLDVFNSVNQKMEPTQQKLFLSVAREYAASTVLKECMFFVAGGYNAENCEITDTIEYIKVC
ncbi:F-box/kelch-repeat protein [Smittium culicis]|uniref:F-box/kelch-repeat protein n=1 Tax=Smittium culicis TaxID=133412 RepID=A0A1R1Y6R2_9FUNG|nr:F-box/kelch-repeat protein [Smittium culicis]OMJ22495.1 F-box/kelch-repeat protein [Smittium culicis]